MTNLPYPHLPDKLRVREAIEAIEAALRTFWHELNESCPGHASDVVDQDLLPRFAAAFEQALRFWLTLRDVRPEPDSTRLYLFARDLHQIYERWRAEPDAWKRGWEPDEE
jgi:hypothetical protein